MLDHFDHEINEVLGGAERPDGSRVRVRIALLAGADLIQTMSTPGVWSEADLDHILGRFGTFIVERTGTDIDDALANLQPYKENIYVRMHRSFSNRLGFSISEYVMLTMIVIGHSTAYSE